MGVSISRTQARAGRRAVPSDRGRLARRFAASRGAVFFARASRPARPEPATSLSQNFRGIIQSMTKKLIKLSIAIFVIAGVVGSSFSTKAYPAFLRKAQKFGAKNCLYCHKQPTGGEGWNERGEWLIAEKERRKADAVDPEWLADYKEGAKKDAENKEGVKKDAENE